ncbi:bacitracin ABC transporter ATP-binding protein [Paenibacillus rhizosphaerae]|uniref:Bacitracin ABC transporter ATP-binding protein n=2 Tax=Paenibacillus TaxID=44249 RepID=A0A1R1ELB0_9BACL|nr:MULTISPECIES: ABC transporter ATP-binding protein [Paenibacillus]OMF52590.1 bacitracin ABC transporter ATP-binding protein [Paenibacillus rhizosphaerae]GIO56241.1 ABC transporter ATP-binding protein [Paenibacillus cineris]
MNHRTNMQADADAPVLSLQGVSKRIGSKWIVSQLSFDVHKGEVVGLLGPNGAGKTTTIRMIAGLIGMTEGDVLVRGSSIRNDWKQAIRHIGAIIENPEFYPYMTGYDNLKQYQRMNPWISRERIDEVVRLVGLEQAMKKKVKAYSLGMRQRLGIAQALLHEPSVLILDEPTNGLDPAGIREMRDYLKNIAREEGISILVSSHLLLEMEQLCSRVVVIQDGKLVTVRSIGGGSGEAVQPGQQEAMRVMFRVGRLEEAKRLLEGLDLAEVLAVNPEQSEMILSLQYKDIPGVVERLGSGRIPIYLITELKQSLEDEFLKWTGGNQIA